MKLSKSSKYFTKLKKGLNIKFVIPTCKISENS